MMSFSGGRRLAMFSSLVVLLIISVLQIWVLSESRVGAIRIYPESRGASEEFSQTMESNEKNQTDLFHKYFQGRVSDLNTTTFQDNKRRVPSCPDPLHNK